MDGVQVEYRALPEMNGTINRHPKILLMKYSGLVESRLCGEAIILHFPLLVGG